MNSLTPVQPSLLSAGIVDDVDALVLLVDGEGRIALFNRACVTALGWPAGQAVGQHYAAILRDADGGDALRRIFDALAAGGAPAHVQGAWRTRDGDVRLVAWTLKVVDDAVGDAVGDGERTRYVLATGVDVTELRGAAARLDYVSQYDTLTGLPNRLLLRERLRAMKGQAKLHERVLGFMLVRFGRMALIADALGPAAEQAVLRQAARRLRALAGQDVAGRFGDDAFALSLLRHDTDELGRQAERLLTALGAPYVVGGEELYLDPRIGIAVYPDDALAYDALAKHAEAALRQIVDGSVQRHAFYRPEFNLDAGERVRLEIALRQAIDRDELVLHYQPQVDLASGVIVGAEALLRWQHPERGMISPAHFIPLAEQSSLILLVGEWTLRTACAQLRDWRKAGLPIVPVSVNLSAHQFSARIVTALRRTLDAYGVEAAMVELELTETASMADAAQSRDLLQQLKALGVGLAIDDFGTGYSNLNYLKRFPIDKIKLDQSFVRDIQNDAGDLAISRAVVALGHGLRLVVVAEGVETSVQRDLLSRLGCDVGQGYLFSPPVPAAAFARMLADGLPAAAPAADPVPLTHRPPNRGPA